jgi:hypothetical protein
MDWNEATTVEQVGEGRFRASVDEEWTSLQGAHGGIVAALAVTATEQVLGEAGVDPTTSLRAATFGYVRGNQIGDLDIDVEVVRQEDKATTLARLHHSTPWDGPAYSDAPPPPDRPSSTVRLARPERPAHINNVETHLHPDTTIFGGADRAEWIAWSRPIGGGTFDSAWLVMFGDYFPPAVFARATEPQRAVTIEYSIQVHDARGRWTLDADEHLSARMHTFHSHDGFAVEDGWIHLPDGELLATIRQTRLAG